MLFTHIPKQANFAIQLTCSYIRYKTMRINTIIKTQRNNEYKHTGTILTRDKNIHLNLVVNINNVIMAAFSVFSNGTELQLDKQFNTSDSGKWSLRFNMCFSQIMHLAYCTKLKRNKGSCLW